MDDDTSAGTSGTYAEMVEEVEKVSEILTTTQSKLWETQDELKVSAEKTSALTSRLHESELDVQRLQQDNAMLRQDLETLQQEMADIDNARSRPMLEQRLRKAVEFLKKDLEEAREKYMSSVETVRLQKNEFEKLKESKQQLLERIRESEKENKATDSRFNTSQDQLQEAKEETTRLVEEVGSLREELQRMRNIADKRESMMRAEVMRKVKERITLDVRETVSEQVTQKVTRELTAKLKEEREREITALREQFKKVFKENSILKEEVNVLEAVTKDTRKLEDQVPILKYEVSRLLAELDKAKEEQEVAISELESYFSKKIQALKEESAKEKWAHATEIRKKLSKERQDEA